MAVGSLLQTYLSRFGVSMEGMSGETIGFAVALDAVAASIRLSLERSWASWSISERI